jgi:predicted DNA-binding protein (MmcQ/YjbR family)
MEKERLRKEELQRQSQAEWDKLDEETKFFKTSENIFKEPKIGFDNKPAQFKLKAAEEKLAQLQASVDQSEDGKLALKQQQEEVELLRQKSNIGVAVCEKQSFELIEFEEMVKIEGGCWLRFMKIPIVNPQAVLNNAKGAPQKGKPGAPSEEPKPIIGRAWVSLADL